MDCIDKERKILLQFKEGLKDPSVFDNQTGHVSRLELRGKTLVQLIKLDLVAINTYTKSSQSCIAYSDITIYLYKTLRKQMALQGTMKLGPWGGTGGSDWSYNPGSGSALKEIVINHGRVVDSISFKSIDATGQTQFSDEFGGNGGTTDQFGSSNGLGLKQVYTSTEIVGFHGRGGYYVNAIGIHAKPSTN
ncbi:hypothetical protein ACOSP7_018657 [Xanthoceras sorbifolium]